jgi:hypothetical protein
MLVLGLLLNQPMLLHAGGAYLVYTTGGYAAGTGSGSGEARTGRSAGEDCGGYTVSAAYGLE